MANLNINVSANTAGANKGIDSLRSNLKGIGGVAKGVTGAISGMMAPLIGIVAVLGGVTAAFRGVSDVIDYGGELDDMSSKTKIAVKDLVVLKEAFKFAGMESADLGKIVNGLSSKLDAPSPKILAVMDQLGLSMEKVQSLSIGERFEVVGEAIGNLSSETARAAASQTLFGKAAGNNLLVLFNNKGAMDEARKSVGGLAGTMEKNAASFAGVGDSLDSIITKSRQFFAALLGQNIDRLKEVADLIMGIDLTKAGEAAGRFLDRFLVIGDVMSDALADGKFFSTITTGIFLAFKEATPYLIGTFKYLGQVMADAFKNAAVQPIADELGRVTRSVVLGIDSFLTGNDYKEVQPKRENDTLAGYIAAEKGSVNYTPDEQALRDKISGKRIEPINETFKSDLFKSIQRIFVDLTPALISSSPAINFNEAADKKKLAASSPLEFGGLMNSLASLRGNNSEFLNSKQRIGGAAIFMGNPTVTEQKKTNDLVRELINWHKANPPNKGGTGNTAATFN